jgi:DNA mismatch repair protein MutS2
MWFSKDLKSDLGFGDIISKLSVECHCDASLRKIADISPQSDLHKIHRIHNKTDEILASIDRGDGIPIQTIPDIIDWIEIIKIEGNLLSPEQFKLIKDILILSREIKKYCNSSDFQNWKKITSEMFVSTEIENKIDSVFDTDFTVKSSASKALSGIRKKIATTEIYIQKRMQDIFQDALSNDWLQDKQISWQDGRLVLPLKSSQKRKIKGIVHRSSATGQTAFVEPYEIIEKNNSITELKSDEKTEIYRILKELTAQLRPFSREFKLTFNILVDFDVHLAYARLAKSLKANRPDIVESRVLQLVNAKNPVLLFTGKTVVPLTLEIPSSKRILLLSGPNAGGKTVVLKTVGLLSVMALCGLFIPAEKAKIPFFTKILTDIGDRQSIKNDLSTFSAHIKNLSDIITTCDDRTLVLLDELGTGTDPDAGSAISRALLEYFLLSKTFVIATTHLGILKVWAQDIDGIQNGGMVFNSKKLAPTYELKIGTPGGSYALEISKRMGLSQVVIDRAAELIGDTSITLENIISELQSEKEIAQKLNEELLIQKNEVNLKEVEINRLQAETRKKHKSSRSDATREARQIVVDTRRDIEKLVQSIKEHGADKESAKQARKSLDRKQKKLESRIYASEENTDNPLLISDVIVGEIVYVTHLNANGRVVNPPDKKKKVTVEINGIKLTLPINQLEPIAKDTVIKETGNLSNSVINVSTVASYQIDLRGMRVNQALVEVDKFLDGALLSGLLSVNILHGKGTGVLQEAIQARLKETPFVKKFSFAKSELGGAGITVVEL